MTGDITELFEIVPINDGLHYLCKDKSGQYFKRHKGESQTKEDLVFISKKVAQDYIDKYLDANKYIPEVFGYNIDYLVADLIEEV
jgi:hypothetical protein